MSANSDLAQNAKPSGGAPLVTIIVPVFNGGRYLRESLDSILDQTYPDTEVIVMNDASTDGTAGIIESYGSRVRAVTQDANRGIYGNMNCGIARASGEFIAVYHADDVYDRYIVEREVEFLQTYPEAGAVFCSDIFIDPDGAERGRLVLPAEIRGGRPLSYSTVFNGLLTYRNRFLRCPSCMVRADVHKQVGLYRDGQFRNTSDLDMYLRIARAYPIGVLEEHLFRYRWGHGNSAQRYRHMRTEEERFFTIMDLYLEGGDRAIATRRALAAYEAHRSEDQLMRAVNLFISGRLAEARDLLAHVKMGRIAASGQVQRGRLLVLLGLLTVLTRLPRVPFMAALFYRRWHGERGRLVARPPEVEA